MQIDFAKIREILNKPPNSLSPYLGELVSRGALLRIEHGVYQVFHPLFLIYLREIRTTGYLLRSRTRSPSVVIGPLQSFIFSDDSDAKK